MIQKAIFDLAGSPISTFSNGNHICDPYRPSQRRLLVHAAGEKTEAQERVEGLNVKVRTRSKLIALLHCLVWAHSPPLLMAPCHPKAALIVE